MRARRDRLIFWSSFFSVALWLLTSAWVIWKLFPEGKRAGILVLHYTVYLGIDDVRPWPWVFRSIGIVAGIAIVNAIVSLLVIQKDALAARAMSMLTTAIVILWSVSQIFVVRVNV